jgi:hypothetical protein
MGVDACHPYPIRSSSRATPNLLSSGSAASHLAKDSGQATPSSNFFILFYFSFYSFIFFIISDMCRYIIRFDSMNLFVIFL